MCKRIIIPGRSAAIFLACFLAQIVSAAVSVTVQPPSFYFEIGDTVVFNTAVTTTAGEVVEGYVWSESSTNIPPYTSIPDATNASLEFDNVQAESAGYYVATVFYASGNVHGLSVKSAPALLAPLVPPAITNATNATFQQGFAVNETIGASGSPALTFTADGLPPGLAIAPDTGVISGIPTAPGVFPVTVQVANRVGATTNIVLTVLSDVPGITSALVASGLEGRAFSYQLKASNNPTSFSATGLPAGLNFNPATGLLSGAPLVNGLFPIAITASNFWGGDARILALTLGNGAPGITSALVASGVEGQSNFTYTIKASNAPAFFSATGLPAGLLVNPTNGVISGSLLFGGTNQVVIFAANAYGVGSNTLQLQVAYRAISALGIANVTYVYSAPYLLDFTFSLRDNSNAFNNPSLGNAVVRPPEQLTVTCMEGDTNSLTRPPIPNETAFIVNKAVNAKRYKTFFALDYSYSMFGTPNAIPEMQAAVENLIDQQPASAQFGVVEFSADYVEPQLVTGLTSDKRLLTADIEGIQTNFVQGNYAGTRLYDGMAAALSAMTAPAVNEENFLIVMSDGYDDSSTLAIPTNSTAVGVLVGLAQAVNAKIYSVGFGPTPNTPVLQSLALSTGGGYYQAATANDVASQFALLLKDLDSEYLLRWATLQRSTTPFQPMFSVTIGTNVAKYNTDFVLTNVGQTVDTNTTPATTNLIFAYTSEDGFFFPASWSGNVRVGELSLAADASTNISSITLSAEYVPRFTRELDFHYRANYLGEPVLLQNGPGEILDGWTLTTTNDGGGGQWLRLASPDTNDVSTSLPYGVMSDLIQFQFPYQSVPLAQQAFSIFDVETNFYAAVLPNPLGFTLDSTAFIKPFPPLPPFGTPPAWLLSYGYKETNDLAGLELTNGHNGMALWQDYIAGFNPLDATTTFVVNAFTPPSTNQAPQVTFNTTVGRTYRVDATTALGGWFPLMDNIAGTGGPITVQDNRNLASVGGVFYRIAVRYQ